MSLVTCALCGRCCQSGKASFWYHGTEKRYRCVTCLRRLRSGMPGQILVDTSTGRISPAWSDEVVA